MYNLGWWRLGNSLVQNEVNEGFESKAQGIFFVSFVCFCINLKGRRAGGLNIYTFLKSSCLAGRELAHRGADALPGCRMGRFISVFIRVHPPLRTAPADSCSKTGFFRASVKKTYLTLLGLTAVFANKIKGFVAEKNRFREAVKNPAFLLKWLNEHALLREWESPGGIDFTAKNTKGTET